MKRFTAIPTLALIALWLTACASVETNALRTIGMIQVSAKGAIEGWRDYVATGKASKSDEDSVRVLWAKFQEASAIAEKAQKAYSATRDVSQLQAAAAVMSAAGQELVEFIYIFAQKPGKPSK